MKPRSDQPPTDRGLIAAVRALPGTSTSVSRDQTVNVIDTGTHEAEDEGRQEIPS